MNRYAALKVGRSLGERRREKDVPENATWRREDVFLRGWGERED